MSGKNCSLYFHVPFCRKKCDYCHFYVIPDKDSSKEKYMQALSLEWQRQKRLLKDYQIQSIYFGGGTPSLLGPDRIAEILSWVELDHGYTPEIEITLEANPEDAEISLMRDYASVGVNRCSIGIQALDDTLLQVLSRGHTAQQAKDAVNGVYASGIRNISIDLMYDLPSQTFEQWKETLKEALRLPVTHLSIYNLVFEPHTVFFKNRRKLQQMLPNEETSARMYEEALDRTQQAGFLQYEISAFEKPGYSSCHNRGYWEGRPFLGFGPSAFSYWNGIRFRNHANLSRYHCCLQEERSPVDFEEKLEGEKKRRELLAVQLRMIQGVDMTQFQERYGELNEETLNTLKSLACSGFITMEKRIMLTRKGILFYDTAASEIV